MKKAYELVPHTADLKMRAYGTTVEHLFSNALEGMFACIKPKADTIAYDGDTPLVTTFSVERPVSVTAPELELLLVDFLSECLYLSDVNNEAYFKATFTALTPQSLEGTVYGVPIEGFEVVEIKAVTYHDLTVTQVDGHWQATIVFDI